MLGSCWQLIIPKETLQDKIPILLDKAKQSHRDLNVLCMNRRHKFVGGDNSEEQRRVQRDDHPSIPKTAEGR